MDTSGHNAHAGVWLIAVDGRDVPPIEVPRGRTAQIGRSSGCSVVLEDLTVSRQHAEIGWRGGWPYIEDRGSTHGTRLNGQKIPVAQPEILATGDWIQIGPWTFEVSATGVERATWIGTQLFADSNEGAVRGTTDPTVTEPTHRILDSIMLMVTRAAAASSIAAVGQEACRLLAKDGGWDVTLLIRAPASGLRAEVVASSDDPPQLPTVPISRTLVTSALQSPGPVMLSRRPELYGAQSLIIGEIADAMCVAIPAEGAATYLLYAFCTSGSMTSTIEPTTLANAVANGCRIGIQALQQRERERAHLEIERELQSARVVQEQLLPPAYGTVGGLEYAYINLPGRFVSGDFVDVIAIDEHRTAVIVGDVVGEGPAAAVLMSSVVAQLRTALSLGCPAAQAVRSLNQRLLARPLSGRFVTLWLGVFDALHRELRVIDAGHGLWFLTGRPLDEANPVEAMACPIGVIDDGDSHELVMKLEVGTSVMVVTDGVTECRDPSTGSQMGISPLRTLTFDGSAIDTAGKIIEVARRHTSGAPFRDDATVVVLRLTP